MNELIGSDARKYDTKEEGPVAKAIERRTAKLPSDLFLWAATGALIGSAVLHFVGQRRTLTAMRPRMNDLFVGQWVPTLLLLGVYNKIVKVAGSDRSSSDGYGSSSSGFGSETMNR